MKKSLYILLLCHALCADEGTLQQRCSEKPNRIYLGPEFLAFQVNTHVKSAKVDGHRFFWGLHLGYEYAKPKHFYGAAEIVATSAAHNFSTSNNSLFYRGKGGAGFGSIQTRFGYTAPAGRHLVTPYLGLGVYSLAKYSHNGFKEGFGYLAAGVRSLFDCSRRCAVGINGEIFRTLGLHQRVQLRSEKVSNHTNRWGASIGIPLMIYISPGWDLQLTPYYTRLVFSQNQNIYGTNLLFGYRF